MTDDFYIGWEDEAPTSTRRWLRGLAALLVGIALGVAVALAASQRSIGPGVFEWGHPRTFTGILRAEPVPHLLVRRPGQAAGSSAWSAYYLVRPFKFGVDPAVARAFDGRPVRLRGTLIHRGAQTMIEVDEHDIAATTEPAPPPPAPVSLGEQTLTGEIVDSKCYLGVMNPGNLIPHRACAIRCLSGGIPPLLLVRSANGPPQHVLLVGRDGRPVNRDVLPFVAEPVSITGELVRQGDLLSLRADPATLRRVSR